MGGQIFLIQQLVGSYLSGLSKVNDQMLRSFNISPDPFNDLYQRENWHEKMWYPDSGFQNFRSPSPNLKHAQTKNQAEIVTLSLFWKPTIFEYRLFMYSVHSRQQSLRRYNILTTGPTQNMAGRWWCLQSADRLWASRNVLSLRNCCKQQQP